MKTVDHIRYKSASGTLDIREAQSCDRERDLVHKCLKMFPSSYLHSLLNRPKLHFKGCLCLRRTDWSHCGPLLHRSTLWRILSYLLFEPAPWWLLSYRLLHCKDYLTSYKWLEKFTNTWRPLLTLFIYEQHNLQVTPLWPPHIQQIHYHKRLGGQH